MGVKGAGIHSEAVVYDEAHIKERSRVIALAIDARRQRYPEEVAFDYKPFAGETHRWDEKAQASIKDYNMLDLSI